LAQRSGTSPGDGPSEWLDARAAADYLGIHRDTLRSCPLSEQSPSIRMDRGASSTAAATSSTSGVTRLDRHAGAR
jgi:hypothetical protein